MKYKGYLIILAMLVQWPGHGAPDVCDNNYRPETDTIWETLQEKYKAGCYKTAVEPYREMQSTVVSNSERNSTAVRSWILLRDYALLSVSYPNNALSELHTAISNRANSAADAVKKAGASGTATDPAGKSAWTILWPLGFLAKSSTQEKIDLKGAIKEACTREIQTLEATAEQLCQSVFHNSEKIFQVIFIGETISTWYGTFIVNELALDLKQVNEDWDKFLFKSKPMFPLDLVFTDLVHRSFFDYGKSDEGFKRPPSYQLFFLHPAPAFEYVSNAADGEQLKPSILLEVVGINMWKWRYLTGLGVTVSYTDRSVLDDVRYGLQFTYRNNFSLAVTSDFDSATGIMLSLELARFFSDSLKPTINRIRNR